MNNFKALLAQQNSATEVLVFLAFTVALFLGIALVLYVLLMAMLRPGLPKKVPLRRILLPTASQLGENLGNYTLVVASSLLLSLTLLAKHDLVQQIAHHEVEPVNIEQMGLLFDYDLPEEVKLRLVGQHLGQVVQPILKAGRFEEASLLVQAVIPRVKQRHPQWLTPANLLIACCILAGLYLGWLARRRFQVLRRDPDSAPDYSSTLRSLLTLGLCVGLLLASALPLAEGGEHLLGNSALAAIAHDPEAAESSIAKEVRDELERQRTKKSALFCSTCGDRSIWEVVEEGAVGAEEWGKRLGEHIASSDRVDAAIQSEFETASSALEALRDQIAMLEAATTLLTRRLTAAESDAREREQSLTRLQSGAVERARRLSAVEVATAALESRLARVEASVRDAEVDAAARDSRLGKVEASAREAAACCRLRDTEIRDLTTRQSQDRGQLKEAVDDERQQRQNELRELSRQLSSIEETLVELQRLRVD